MATMIFGVAVGACVLSFSMGMRIVNTASNQMDSLQDVRSQMEMLRTNHFTSAALNAGSYSLSNANYTGNYVVTNVDAWTKNITVNVVYVNRIRGGNSTNTLVTLVSHLRFIHEPGKNKTTSIRCRNDNSGVNGCHSDWLHCAPRISGGIFYFSPFLQHHHTDAQYIQRGQSCVRADGYRSWWQCRLARGYREHCHLLQYR